VNPAGVSSRFPAASIPATWNRCVPSVTLVVKGEVQATATPESIWHSNVPGSVLMKENVSCELLVRMGGAPVR